MKLWRSTDVGVAVDVGAFDTVSYERDTELISQVILRHLPLRLGLQNPDFTFAVI